LSRIPGLRWDSWPDPIDEHLLRALLHEDLAVARASWQTFRAQTNLDAPNQEQYRLFGAIADRLELIDPEDDRIGMFQGVRRLTAVNTMTKVRQLDEYLQTFDQLGVEPVVLKGTAFVLTAYESFGQRWFSDTDLLVTPSEWDRVADEFRRQGWSSIQDDFGGNHGVNMRRGNEVLDLHRLVHSEIVIPGHMAQTMSLLETTVAERPLPSGRLVRVLAPTDALLHTFVHGTQRLLPHNLRWTLDAERLIATGEIDWYRLINLSRTFRLSPLIHDALLFLGTLTGRPTEPWVTKMLAADRLSLLERMRIDAFHEWPSTGGAMGKGLTNLSWALWRTRSLDRAGLVRHFPQAFAECMGARSIWDLPRVFARRLGGRDATSD
jgi:hypothetical protein